MMLAAKHFDPVVGVDIHIIQPPGPVPPLPVPHPFIGFLIDPMDYVPMIGGTVKVNGMMRAQAGTAGKAVPAHIPIGGAFVPPPPGNECEMFMGSATVDVDGDAFSYLALPALSCQSVGMPPPPRVKKKSETKSLVLPTSVVLPIPGPPVLVGGPPTISLAGMVMKVGLAGLGRALKALAKTKAFQKFMAAFKKARQKAAKGLPPGFLKCKVLRAEPVDITTGEVVVEQEDFSFHWPLPLSWRRYYHSQSRRQGVCGVGWETPADIRLERDSDGSVVFYDGGPGGVVFANLPDDGPVREAVDGGVLSGSPSRLRVQTKSGSIYSFPHFGRGETEVVVESIGDTCGNRLDFRRDADGLCEIVSSSGCRIDIASRRGVMQSMTLYHPEHPGPHALMRYEYDDRDDLRAVLDQLGNPYRFRYDNHCLVQHTDRNGLSFYYEYDEPLPDGRVLHAWGDGGLYDYRFEYDEVLNSVRITDSLGHVSQVDKDERGFPVRETDPLGGVTSFEYDAAGRTTAVGHPDGCRTEYLYDEFGNLLELTQADGSKVVTEFDTNNNPVRVVDANGSEWRLDWDVRGLLERQRTPLGTSIRYSYDARGQPIGVVDAAGNSTSLSYDGAGNLASVEAPGGQRTQWAFDSLGRCVSIRDPKGNVQRRQLDALGRIVRVEEPDGNTRELSYDAEGNVVRARDKQSDVVFTYSGLGCLTSRREAGTTVEFLYDTEEQLIGIRNEHGYVYRFERGPTGNVDVETGFDGIRRLYHRDAMGRVVELIRASGITTRYAYDGAGRVVEIAHSDGNSEKYEYRADGELLAAVNDATAVKFERDALGRILIEAQGNHWVRSEYDPVGMRIRMQSSLGADQLIKRNAMGDVEEVEHATADGAAWKVGFKRDSVGLELERVLPGGLSARWERDNLGRPVHQQIQSRSGVAREREYTWGINDRLRQVRDSVSGTIVYEHDARGSLVSAKYGDGTVDLRMPDAVGNLFRTKDRSDRKYGPAGQLLEAKGRHGTTRYEYDAEGNLIRKVEPGNRLWQYEWNAAGMLAKVVRPDSRVVTFEYDALGRRIGKTYRGKKTCWVWDGNNPLHEWVEVTKQDSEIAVAPTGEGPARRLPLEGDLAGHPPTGPPSSEETPITWLFEPESFAPMAKLVGEQRYSIITDHLGTPFSMVDSRGEQVWAAELDMYGELRSLNGERSACLFRWPGQYEDVESGLYYNRFRYYDPGAGQYASQDPIGLMGVNPNFYGYVPDASTQVDELGLSCKKVKVGDSIAPGVTVKRIKNGTNGKGIVIGRNMSDRVIPAAKNINAEYWKGFDASLPPSVNLDNNRKWLEQKLADGYSVVDVGLDPEFVKMGGRGSRSKGPFYKMETQVAFGTKT